MQRVLICLLTLFAVTANAATYYLDSAASGANDGSSWTDAFETWDDAEAHSWSSGDVLLVSGGSTTKTYSITDGDNELPSNVTMRIGQTSGHDGIAVFDFNETSSGPQFGFKLNNGFTLDGEVAGDGEKHFLFANLINYTTNTGKTHGRMFGYNDGADLDSVVMDYFVISNASTGIYFINAGSGINIGNFEMKQIRGDAGITAFGGVETWDNIVFHDFSIECIKSSARPSGASGSWGGPDHLQLGSGTTVRDYTMTIVRNQSLYTSTQHMDNHQIQGGQIKMYNFDITDTGDAVFTAGGALTSAIRDIHIYNGVVRRTQGTSLTTYPEVLRVYGHSATPIDSMNRVWFQNVTVIDFDFYTAIRFDRTETTTTIDDIRIENCLFYNSGASSSQRLIYIALNGGATFDPADWEFNNNVYYHPTQTGDLFRIQGTNYTRAEFVATFDANGQTGQPTFESYSEGDSGNTGKIDSGDTVAIDNGATLSSYFTTDFENETRSGSWDIGADEYVSGGSDVTPPVIGNVDVEITGSTTATVTFTTDEPAKTGVEWDTSSGAPHGNVATNDTFATSHSIDLTGLSAATTHYYIVTARDADGNYDEVAEDTFDTTTESPVLGLDTTALQWIQATNTTADLTLSITNTGGGTLTGTASVGGSPFSLPAVSSYSLAADASTNITVRYSPTSAQHDVDTLTLTGGGGATVDLNGIAFAVQDYTDVTADASTLVVGTTQFVSTNSYIFQEDEELDPDLSARAIFGFEITTAGDYVIEAQVDAPDAGRDSFYVDDNEAPENPDDIWDVIPVTSGQDVRQLNQRGSGTFDNPQYAPRVFTFSSGQHYLDLRGREQETKIYGFEVRAYGPSGSSRRVPSRSIGSGGGVGGF